METDASIRRFCGSLHGARKSLHRKEERKRERGTEKRRDITVITEDMDCGEIGFETLTFHFTVSKVDSECLYVLI